MPQNKRTPEKNVFLSIKWDNSIKLGSITTLTDEQIHFYIDDIENMIATLIKIKHEAKKND